MESQRQMRDVFRDSHLSQHKPSTCDCSGVRLPFVRRVRFLLRRLHNWCHRAGLLLIVATTPADLCMALLALVDEHRHHIITALACIPPTDTPVAFVLADMIVAKVISHGSDSTRSLVIDRITSDNDFSSFDQAVFIELRAGAISPASVAHVAELLSADASVRRSSSQLPSVYAGKRRTHVMWLQPVANASILPHSLHRCQHSVRAKASTL